MSHILLIDDDEDMLAMAGRWLEKNGYTVSKATSGKEGLDIMASSKPDLVLLDFAMPEMDGPAVLKEIRTNPDTKDIPVLFRTGMEDEALLNELEYKPNGVVSKAEGKNALIQAVERILK